MNILRFLTGLRVCAKTIHNYANIDKLIKNIYLISKTNKKSKKVHNCLPILMINTFTQKSYKFSSIKEVANTFKVKDSTIRYYMLNNKKYFQIYDIKCDKSYS